MSYIAGHYGTGKTVIGVEALKIIRAKHLEAIEAQIFEAEPKVIVHLLVYSTVLSDLTKNLQNMIEDIGVKVSCILPGRSAIKSTVQEILKGTCLLLKSYACRSYQIYQFIFFL